MNIGIAVTGASGSIYADLLLEYLRSHQNELDLTVQLVMSTNADTVWKEERNNNNLGIYQEHFDTYKKNNFYAPMASGSSDTEALIICPCSMGTLGRIAAGVSDDLITRAADVMLKEKKKLIIVPRESPYNLIHLKNMQTLAEAGAHIIPASPSFYSRPDDIESLCMTVVYRILNTIGIKTQSYKWPNR